MWDALYHRYILRRRYTGAARKGTGLLHVFKLVAQGLHVLPTNQMRRSLLLLTLMVPMFQQGVL